MRLERILNEVRHSPRFSLSLPFNPSREKNWNSIDPTSLRCLAKTNSLLSDQKAMNELCCVSKSNFKIELADAILVSVQSVSSIWCAVLSSLAAFRMAGFLTALSDFRWYRAHQKSKYKKPDEVSE